MKNITTLFHGTKKIEHLTSILCNGFYASYSDESIADRKTKILMTSFSNVPLIESRNQVSYRDYFIGLKRDWGVSNGLHPVAYTYKGSNYEKNVWNLTREAALGQTLNIQKEYKDKGLEFTFQGKSIRKLSELDLTNLNDKNIEALEKIFESTHREMYEMILYIKPYIVKDSKGIERLAFNDREWRYIPEQVEEKILYETNARGDLKNDLYKTWSAKPKPHYKEKPLKFDLKDVNFIIVKEISEIHIVYNILHEKFTKEKVYKLISNGELTILSLDRILSDL